MSTDAGVIETRIPERMDRLPWARWHWLVIIGLGTVWILDGLEVTIVGAISSRLTEKGSGISITTSQIGVAATVYVTGACLGALFFGYLADRMGRKKLFLITLGLYLVATTATAFTNTALLFFVARFFTGAGIGGEYAAINSAIDELIPARVRGTVDLIINGSFWLGTAAGSALSLLLLDKHLFSADVGWRLAFGLGAILGVGILIVRRHVPESPRWMFIHGRAEEADELVSGIEQDVAQDTGEKLPELDGEPLKVQTRESVGFLEIARTVFGTYPRRTAVGLSLFVGQAFMYNAVFFSFGVFFTTFYGVSSSLVPVFIIPFAIGNFLGPLVLGRLFDTVGRRPMISGTYILSGVLLAINAILFKNGVYGAWTQTLALSIVFFFASAGASSAYLTVSEIFPMETRAMAIAFFYAVGTFVGGATGPLLFAKLIASGHENQVVFGFMLGAALMIGGGLVQAFLGVEAAQKNLEDVATPLSAQEADGAERTGDSQRTPEAPAATPAPAAVATPAPSRPRARERVRFGASAAQTGWSPSLQHSSRSGDDRFLPVEVDSIATAVEAAGETGIARSALGDQVRCRTWGPGRFRRALGVAVAEGRIAPGGRGRFVPAPQARARRGSEPASDHVGRR